MSLTRFSQTLPLLTSLPLPLLTFLLAAIPVLQAYNAAALPPPPSSPGPGVRILRAPESRVAPPGDEVVFICETSLPPERFEWSYAASGQQAQQQRFKYLKSSQNKSNLHNNNLTITNDNDISRLRVFVRSDTLGDYRCVAWFGPLAVTSTTARLELASIGGAAGNHTEWRVAAGNTVIWQCGTVNSNPPASWSFYHNGRQIQSLGSNGTLLLAGVSAAQSGSYTCMATNTAAGVRITLPSALELQVLKGNELVNQAPHLLQEEQLGSKVVARLGETVLLLCPGVGNPAPKAVWSRPLSALSNRSRSLPAGLQIQQLKLEDAGNYNCFLDNGQRPAVEHAINLQIQQLPEILLPPQANLTNEGERMQLDCVAKGVPKPQIYWLLNGESSNFDAEAELQPNGSLILHSVQKRHAGYVQCFARNLLGEHSAGTLLQVNPKQIQSTINDPTRPRRKQKQQLAQQLVPPSAPNVTRLSDESVMLRWHVRNEGLPIQFFKVQYRMADSGKRKSWHTTNENIPYGKEQRQHSHSHSIVKNFTSSVTGLRADRSYRFRIMAVYSNNDNKESNTSGKFFLQRGAALQPLAVPELVNIEEYSQTAVVLHWRLCSDANEQLISGYYAYYRPSASAGEYQKATIDGAHSQSFQISALEPGTIYEFKLQSFSAVAASEFSALKQGRTQRPKQLTTVQPILNNLDTTTASHNETFHMHPLLTGTIGGAALLLLLVISGCLCLCRRRNSRAGSAQQQHKPRLAELREDFVPLSACSPNKPRTRHIHITLNPLLHPANPAQQQEEKEAAEQDLTYFQRPAVVYDQETLSNYNPHTRLSNSSSLRRATSGGNNNNLNQQQEGNQNLSTADSPRLQSSNKPVRVILKRTRLSSRSENLSSGSLNSVGV